MGNQAMTNTFYIEITPHNGKIWRFPLPPDQLLVGRSPNRCGLVIDDPRVSRIHLRITRSPDFGVTITEMYSANGSTLDGRSLPSGIAISWLIEQTIIVGSTSLILRYGKLPDTLPELNFDPKDLP
jgi:pSer/pThr/pTyr-binding forkhead associated (FHA) protein